MPIRENMQATADAIRRAARKHPNKPLLQPHPKQKYACLEEFILEHGQGFPIRTPLIKVRRMRHHDCYENAWKTVLQNFGLTYVEGFAQLKTLKIPVVHAWAVDEDGYVIDPTWGFHPASEYIGIAFDWNWVTRAMDKNGQSGILEGCAEAILLGRWKYKRAAVGPR